MLLEITNSKLFEDPDKTISKLEAGNIVYYNGVVSVGMEKDVEESTGIKYEGQYKQHLINLFIRWKTLSATGCTPCREVFRERVKVKILDVVELIRKEYEQM